MRTADGTGGKDHLAIRGDRFQGAFRLVFDAGAGFPFERESPYLGARHDLQVRAMGGQWQEGLRNGMPLAVLDGQVAKADADRVLSVEIRIEGNPQFHGRLYRRGAKRMRFRDSRDIERAAGPVKSVAAA